MTITQLEYFLEVVKCRSITEAANRVFITQPSMGRQITAIETELGVKLLNRTKQGVELTPAGEVFYSEIRRIMKEYKNAVENTTNTYNGQITKLSIGVLEYLAIDDVLSEMIQYFESKYPDIKLDIFTRSFGGLLDAVLEQNADAVISFDFNFTNQPRLDLKDFLEIHPYLAVPTGHFLAKQKSVSYKDLEDVTLVVSGSEDCPFGIDLITRICQKDGGFTPTFHFTDSMKDAMLWVRTGNECSIIVDRIEITDGNLVKKFPLPQHTNDRHYIQIATRKDNNNSALKLFMDFMMKHTPER